MYPIDSKSRDFATFLLSLYVLFAHYLFLDSKSWPLSWTQWGRSLFPGEVVLIFGAVGDFQFRTQEHKVLRTTSCLRDLLELPRQLSAPSTFVSFPGGPGLGRILSVL